MISNDVKLTDVKKLLSGRFIYVRCKDARFLVTRSSFLNSCKRLGHPPFFNIEYDERKIMIEEVNQYLHAGIFT